jgi:hypothetical protein
MQRPGFDAAERGAAPARCFGAVVTQGCAKLGAAIRRPLASLQFSSISLTYVFLTYPM